MAVRNFYVSTDIDGRSGKLEGGPGNAKGGFTQVIKIRANGSPVTAVEINGYVAADGSLVLDVLPARSYAARAKGVTVIPRTPSPSGGFTVVTER